MILKLVSVKDLAVQAFMQPSFVHHVGLANREFTMAVNKPDHEFAKNPSDFELYELGTFNDQDGSFDTTDCPKLIARAIDVKTS